MSNALSRALERRGFTVSACFDGGTALRSIKEGNHDLVILDLNIPVIDGMYLLQRIRAQGIETPVIVLTARGAVGDRVAGLNAGADDYLAKPFDLAELEARLRALHRRSIGAMDSVLCVATLAFNTVSRRFTLAAHPLDLPPREHDLLEALIVHAGRPVSKLLLAQRLRTCDAVLSNEALEIYVHRLRRRLDHSGVAIHTLRGLGYVLEAAGDAPA